MQQGNDKEDHKQQAIASFNKTKIISWVSTAMICLLIVVYCWLSPSLFSSCCLCFLLIQIFVLIVRPRYLVSSGTLNIQNMQVQSYMCQRILWSIFIVLNVGVLICKLVLVFSDKLEFYDTNYQQFLQLQDLKYTFLPIIMLPFAMGAILFPKISQPFQNYTTKINRPFRVFGFIIFGVLLVWLQISSRSYFGLSMFCCLLILLSQKQLQYTNLFQKYNIIAIGLLIIIIVVANQLTRTTYMISIIQANYELYGIDLFNNWMYAVNLLVLYLWCCILGRLIEYITLYEASKNTAIRQEDPFIDEQLHNNEQILVKDLSKVKSLLQQYELQRMSSPNLDSSRSNMFIRKRALTNLQEPLNVKSVRNHNRSIRDRQNSITSVIKQNDTLVTKIGKMALSIIMFLKSAQLSLRIVQLLSIVVIQRYNNIYSFIALLWLAMLASIDNMRILYYLTLVVLLPIEIINYIILYLYNMSSNPIGTDEHNYIYGFQHMKKPWLDVIVFNMYFLFIFLFASFAAHQKSKNQSNVQKPKQTLGVWIFALIFRYSYIFAIAAMFVVAISKVTLFNMIFMALFLIFFAKGQHALLEYRTRNGRNIPILTTFARKYWFIIVYYTLISIIMRYIYFLFFKDGYSSQLQPTGINYKHNLGFNFSLQEQCLSYTTPLFIIFILMQIQIMIYRSNIYLHYSLSSFETSQSSWFSKLWILVMRFYYQSIFYIAGIIIIICCFYWNFFSLAILAITSYNLVYGFTQYSSWLVVFLDLLFIFFNYIGLFLEYSIVRQILTDNVSQVLFRILYGIGFDINKSQITTNIWNLLLLNVVIFYFSVQCYRINGVLSHIKPQPQNNLNPQQQQQTPLQEERQLTIDVSMDEDKFTSLFQKGQKQIHAYYNCDLIQTYPIFRTFCRITLTLITYIIAIAVIICCLYFRVSVSMLIFLMIYLCYYLALFESIGDIFSQGQYQQKITRQIVNFKSKQQLLINKQQPQSLLFDHQQIQPVKSYFSVMHEQILQLKYQWKAKLWSVSSIWSLICLLLAYSAQFLNSNYYTTYLDYQYTTTIRKVLFILGFSISKTQNIFYEIYFYYLMVIFNVLQRLLMNYITYQRKQRQKKKIIETENSCKMQSIILSSKIDDLIEQRHTHDFVQEIVHLQPISVLSDVNSSQMQQKQHEFSDETIFNTNLLIYFNYRESIIKISIIDGLMSLMIRFYLWILLLNVYSRDTVFTFLYFIALILFWFRKIQFSMVKNINKISIILLALQYLMLLLNVDKQNSPLLPPQGQPLSLLGYLIDNKRVINFLTPNRASISTGEFLQSFLINSVVIFITEIYFILYELNTQIDMKVISALYARYQYIASTLSSMHLQETIYLNFKKYKSLSYRMLLLLYEIAITNSYILISMMIFFLMWSTSNWPTVLLVCTTFVFLYVILFTQLGHSQQIYRYTKINFNIIRVIFFILFFVQLISSLPLFEIGFSQHIEQYGIVISLERIILLLFMQVWLDLKYWDRFQTTTKQYLKMNHVRQQVMLKCWAYQLNNQQISKLIDNYKHILRFDVNMVEAMQIIQQWHKVNNRVGQSNLDRQQSYNTKSESYQQPLNIQLLHQQIRQQMRKSDQTDTQQSIKQIISKILIRNSDVPITHKYYDLMKLIVQVNHRLLKHEQCYIDIWHYVMQDWGKLNHMIESAQQLISKSIQVISAAQQGERIINLRKHIAQQYNAIELAIKNDRKGHIKTPRKIFLNMQQPQPYLYHIMFRFLLSNIGYVLIFCIWIYYIINPCLYSLPFIIYMFSFQTISCRRLTEAVLVYLFIISCTIKIVQLGNLQFEPWIKYLFYGDQQSGQYNFYIGYLFFLFIVIFIDDEISKYRGNKFKHEHQTQNLLQGVLRVLLNEDQDSQLYLWKFYAPKNPQQILEQQQEYYSLQKKSNPMNNFTDVLQTQPSLLSIHQPPQFMSAFRQHKPGIDLYPAIALVQIITLFLLFLYTNLINSQNQSIEDSLKYNQFDSNMVIAILVQTLHMVLQRKITLMPNDNGKKQFIKYCYTMIILVLFCWFIYYLAPYNYQQYKPTSALIGFSLVYFIYFFLSGMQIKFGYKKYKSINSFMTQRSSINGIFMSIFLAIPFLFQLKMLMDWSFTKTSLSIFQWFQMFGIYFSGFRAKLAYIGATSVNLGTYLAWSGKIIGWVGFIIILGIILGPLILFSGLNPTSEPNTVLSGSIQLGIQVIKGNYYTLYSSSHFSQPPKAITRQLYDRYDFGRVSLLKQVLPDELSQQFQLLRFKSFSDYYWSITEPNFEVLKDSINKSINNNNNESYQLLVKYKFQRSVASTVSTINTFTYPSQQNQGLNKQQLEKFYETMTKCNKPFTVNNFYISLIRLNTIGSIYKPRPIFVKGQNNYTQNVNITMQCAKQSEANSTQDIYWALNSTDQQNSSSSNQQGIIMYVLCDKYQSLFQGLSLVGVYTSVVLVLANVIRGVFQVNAADMIYLQNPKPDNILQISQAISTLRTRKKYRGQYLMFYELIDIVRSPEIMKYMSGSYRTLVQKAYEQRIKKQREKELLQARKNQ